MKKCKNHDFYDIFRDINLRGLRCNKRKSRVLPSGLNREFVHSVSVFHRDRKNLFHRTFPRPKFNSAGDSTDNANVHDEIRRLCRGQSQGAPRLKRNRTFA